MIRVITVEREYGSGGGAIAKRLADKLGWQFWDHAITCEIAKRLKCDVNKVELREERCDGAWYRLMKTFMRGSYEDQLGTGAVDLLDAEHLAAMFEKLIADLANKGNCVIVGRGATWFLRDRPDALHAFIYAPRDYKVAHVQRSGHTLAEAEELVERVDRERGAFIKKYYNKNWPQRDLYHLMVNSKIGEDAVLDMLLHELQLIDRLAPEPLQAAG